MIIYRVRSKVAKTQSENWVQYFKKKHLKDLLKTGCFYAYQFNQEENTDGEFDYFEASYFAKNRKDLENYNKHHAAKLKEEVNALFAGSFQSERSILKILDESTRSSVG